MKRCFFYTNAKINEPSAGITKKVKSQVQAFHNLGYEVQFTAYAENGIVLCNSCGEVIKEKKYRFKNPRIQRYTRRYELVLFAKKIVKELGKIEIAYLRYHCFDRLFYLLLKQCKKKCGKVVVEMHAYPSLTLKVDKMLPVYLLDKIWEGRCADNIDYFAAMHDCKKILGKPAVMIHNAIDTSDFKDRREHIYKKKNTISLIAVGYEAKLHGYDLLIRGINEYKTKGGKYDFVVHLVGTYQKSSLKLIKESPYSNYYILHGTKNAEELKKIYEQTDIAIGTLALHRRGGMQSTSSLKLVEYLCMGIPCVYGGRELIIDDSYPFALRFPDNEQPLDMGKVITFYNGLVDKKVTAKQIHDSIAIKENSWETQMNKVIQTCTEGIE